MNKVALSGTIRNEIGTKYAAQLRREKRVPCVLYGGENTVHFSVDESCPEQAGLHPGTQRCRAWISTARRPWPLSRRSNSTRLTDRVIHVDFLELDETKEHECGACACV